MSETTPVATRPLGDIDPRTTTTALVILVIVGVALRIGPALAHDWPMGEGGLFYAFVGDLISAGLTLPDTTTFQSGTIPFAYPPLAFYLLAVVELVTGMTRSDLFRFLPPLLAAACIPAVYLLAHETLRLRTHALLATAFYALLAVDPAVLFVAGGVARAPGMLLALVATWIGLRMIRLGRVRDVFVTGIAAGLAAMTHPEASVFVAIGIGAALVTQRHRRPWLDALAAALIALVVLSPWLVTVVGRHGIGPFVSAFGVGQRDLAASLVAYVFLFLVATPVIGFLELAGQVHQGARRRPRLLVWRIGIFFLDLRYSPVAAAPVVAMLASVGTIEVVAVAAWRFVQGQQERGRLVRWRRAPVVTAVALVAVFGAMVPAGLRSSDLLHQGAALSLADRQAMAWVRAETAPDARLVVLAASSPGSATVTEWFPALARRVSVTTTQGQEFAGVERHAEVMRAANELRECELIDAECIIDWIERQGEGSSAVYLAGPGSSGFDAHRCCVVLRDRLLASGRYRLAYDSPGASVLVPTDTEE